MAKQTKQIKQTKQPKQNVLYDQNRNFKYFHDLVLLLSSTLDMPRAMRDTYELLAQHFPLEAISLHQTIPERTALSLLFFVRSQQFELVRRVVDLPPGTVVAEPPMDQAGTLISIPDNMCNPVSRAHAQTLSDFLPPVSRAYLIGMLQAGDERIGHLCLIGKGVNCFTAEHEYKLRMVLTPFSLAMANMLQFREVVEFQQRLNLEAGPLRNVFDSAPNSQMVGEKFGLKNTMAAVRQLHDREVPVLICGETGTGKELVADAIQRLSPRRNAPFIKINCGAIPDTLVDSELFGYEKGAFTGATAAKPGRFELAHGGTLFLDEVGDLPLQAQVRLLRVLQNGELERVGGTSVIYVDVRIITATNRNLEKMLQEKTFREDLYYRLRVFPISVPPLRERPQDIIPLVIYFMKKIIKINGMRVFPNIPDRVRERLCAYTWPGNVRELENLVEQALILFPPDIPGASLDMDLLLPQDPAWYMNATDGKDYLTELIDKRVAAALGGGLQSPAADSPVQPAPTVASVGAAAEVMPLDDLVREALLRALEISHWRIDGPNGAARMLRVNPSTLRAKMKKLGINSRSAQAQTGIVEQPQ